MIHSLIQLDDDTEVLDFEKSKAILLRTLTPPEIGCAISHRRILFFLAKSKHGGVVLEDDTEIIDVGAFVESCLEFLSHMKNTDAILSLTHIPKFRLFNDKKFRRLRTPPPLAAAYVATPEAAIELASSNTPIFSVADWPNQFIQYYANEFALVNHNPHNFPSTIQNNAGQLTQYTNRLLKALALFSFLHFFRNRKHFQSLRVYWTLMLKPRVFRN